MKLLAGAASLLALTLFLSPVMAQDSAVVDQPATEQQAAEQPAPAAETTTPEVPAEILALLSDSRPASELSDEELRDRAKTARRFAKEASLTEEVRGQLTAIFEASRAEIESRKQAQKKPAKQEPQVQPEQQAAPVEAAPAQVAPVEAAPVEAAAPPPAEQAVPEEIANFLNDGRALADIDSEELKSRAKAARRFGKDEKLPQDIRDKLNVIAQDARIELTKREQPQEQQQAAPAPAPEAPKDQPVKDQPVIVQEAPPVVDASQAVAVEPPPAPPAPAKADVQALDSNAGDPASEKQARAYLDDTTPLEKLSDDELRTRLDNIRDVMASNELSRETERAVRKRLKAERDVLRQRLAVQEAAVVQKQEQVTPPPPPPPLEVIAAAPLPPAPPPPPPLPPVVVNNTTVNNTTVNNTVVITNATPVQVVLRDQRPPEELQISELQRRLSVYNDAQFDEDYDQANRDYWRESMLRDREILRRRMIAERHRREEQLAMDASDNDININIDINLQSDRPRPPRYVFAAEVDDQEMEDVLVAPPRKTIKKRYSVEEIAVEPQLRETVSRIEIDTIHFGSNEAFVREEQMQSLDGIAAIIERIVKKYPNEVFMIEGHTDAPGSDAYNNRLSKLRAEAIKKALVSYYVIPARNLRTVGLGERFLKIPTAEAEGENRRVSISRITDLLTDQE